MRRRLVAGEEVARTHKSLGWPGWSAKSRVAEDLVAERQAAAKWECQREVAHLVRAVR